MTRIQRRLLTALRKNTKGLTYKELALLFQRVPPTSSGQARIVYTHIKPLRYHGYVQATHVLHLTSVGNKGWLFQISEKGKDLLARKIYHASIEVPKGSGSGRRSGKRSSSIQTTATTEPRAGST